MAEISTPIGLDKDPAKTASTSGGAAVLTTPPSTTGSLLSTPPKPAPISVPDLFEAAPSSKVGASDSSSMVSAVVGKTEKKHILGPKPQTAGGIDIQGRSFDFGSTLLKISLLLAILVFGFFYTQLSPSFSLLGQNPVQRLNEYQAQFEDEQTSINLYNYSIAKYALDDFNLAADSYLYALSQYESPYTPSNEKFAYQAELENLQTDMKESLSSMQERLSTLLYPSALLTLPDANALQLEENYTLLLKTKISEDKLALSMNGDADSILQMSNLDSVLALLNATDFRKDLLAVDLNASLDEATISSLYEQSTQTSKSGFSIILNIKSARVDWLTLLTELNAVTKKVDPLYNSGLQSNIEYDNYSLNSSDQTITLQGSTETDDTMNFSLIADLIDKLEESSYFMNVTDRSFTKQEGGETGVTSQFTIELTLQEDVDSRDANYALVVEEAAAEGTPEVSTEAVTEEVATEATPETEETVTEEPTDTAADEEAAYEAAPEGTTGAYEDTSEPIEDTNPEEVSTLFWFASLLNIGGDDVAIHDIPAGIVGPKGPGISREARVSRFVQDPLNS